MKIKHFTKNSAAYVLSILLIFVVATIEYNVLTAIELILKLIAFFLSMLLPIGLSARLSTFNFPSSNSIDKLLRLDIATIAFTGVQAALWIMNLYQLQLYIAVAAIALFLITLFVFLVIRWLGYPP